MIKKSFKSLIRKSRRNTGILLINIIGLTAGLAVFLLISMWIGHEVKYDKFKGSENVYLDDFEVKLYSNR